MSNKANIYLVPHKDGQRKDGVQLGPSEIAKGIEEKTCKIIEVCCTPKEQHETTHSKSTFNCVKSLYLSILDNPSCPLHISVGGDHSIAMGSIAAVSKLKSTPTDPLIVVWIDAHPDINGPISSESGNLHGCPLSFLSGSHRSEWVQVGEGFLEEIVFPQISLKHLIYIGIRDIDESERSIVDGVKTIRVGENIKERLIKFLKDIDPTDSLPIHLSFDIDSLDPCWAPSTGTPVVGGLSPSELMQALHPIKKRVVGIDVVEVNPLICAEQSYKTVALAQQFINSFLPQS